MRSPAPTLLPDLDVDLVEVAADRVVVVAVVEDDDAAVRAVAIGEGDAPARTRRARPRPRARGSRGPGRRSPRGARGARRRGRRPERAAARARPRSRPTGARARGRRSAVDGDVLGARRSTSRRPGRTPPAGASRPRIARRAASIAVRWLASATRSRATARARAASSAARERSARLFARRPPRASGAQRSTCIACVTSASNPPPTGSRPARVSL